MPDINLLQTPSAHVSTLSSRGRIFISRVLMLVLIVVVVGYGALKFFTWQNAKATTDAQAAVAAAQTEALNNNDRKELITRQGQTKQLDTLVKNHLYWSYMLPELAKVSLRSAKYTAITMDDSGALNVTVSLASYEDLEKYMQIFDLPEYNQQFSNVKINSITRTQVDNGIEIVARLELTFNSEFLKGRM